MFKKQRIILFSIVFFLCFLGFLMSCVDDVKAETNSYCVCSYAYTSGGFGGEGACPTELSKLAFKETNPAKCTKSVVKTFVEQIPGDAMCKFGVCEIKMCNSSEDLLQSHPIKPPGGDDEPIISACVPAVDFIGLDKCAKIIAGKNCSLKTKDINNKDTDISICEASCAAQIGCKYDKSTSKCTGDAGSSAESISTTATTSVSGDGSGGGSVVDVLNVPPTGALNPLAVTTVQELIGNAIKTLMGLIGSIALVMFVYGGVLWMTSMGNAEKTKKSMQIIIWSSLGVLVIFASWTIIDFVFEAFR